MWWRLASSVKYIKGFESWTPAEVDVKANFQQVYQGIWELNPSFCGAFRHLDASISRDLRVEPQRLPGCCHGVYKYIKGFESWTPAVKLDCCDVFQVYQGIWESNPSRRLACRRPKASISRDLRVEPQQLWVLGGKIPKYITEPNPSNPSDPSNHPNQDPVYRGLKNKNPAKNQTSTGTSNPNLGKQTYQ